MIVAAEKCHAVILKPEQYRLKRGIGFRLHYAQDTCSRKALPGTDFCWQHAGLRNDGVRIES